MGVDMFLFRDNYGAERHDCSFRFFVEEVAE